MPAHYQNSAFSPAGNWPENLHERYKQSFLNTLGGRYESDIVPLQQQISAQKHPWNIISGVILAIGLYLIFYVNNNAPQWMLPLIIIIGASFCTALMTAIKKNKALGTNRAALNGYLYDISGYNLSDLRHSHMALIDNFKQAAMFACYDKVHYLTGIVPNMAQIHGQPPAPQILSTKLTRTETERYTDGNGNRSRRKRIINVFEGFLLVQTLPEFESENRIVITSRQMWSFEGPFARHLQGRSTKIDEIQTSSLEFNRLFKVNCDDATLAHHFLDPVRIMRFLNLNDDLRAVLGSKKIGLSLLITRGQVWIALEGKGLNKMAEFSGDADKFSQELSQHLDPAILPHIIAQHLQFNLPAPYSWFNG